MRRFKSILAGFLVLFFLYSLTKNFYEYRKNIAFYESYKAEYTKEKRTNSELKTQLLKNSDPHEVEKIIRNKLNLTRPDEVAVIIPLPTPTAYTPSPTPMPVYKQWADSFFKN